MTTPGIQVRRSSTHRLRRRLLSIIAVGSLLGGFTVAVPAAAPAFADTGGGAPPSSDIPPPPDLLNLSEIDAPPTTPQAAVGGNRLPIDRIGTGEFYATPAQIASLQDFEEQAVEDTINAHDFATGDYDTVLSWDRDDADALLFALIDDAWTTAPGDTIPGEALITASDVENVNAWFATAMQRQDVAAAQAAGYEYTRWAGLGTNNYLSLLDSDPSETAVDDFLSATPNAYTDGYSTSNRPTVESSTSPTTPGYDADGGYCSYEPPSPDQGQYEANIFGDNANDVAPQLCYSNCTSILGCPPPTPLLASFQNWGAADLSAQQGDSKAYVDQIRSVSTGAAVLGAISAVAVPAGVAIPAALPAAAVAPLAGSAFQQAVFPYAARAFFTPSGGSSAAAPEATESAEATEAADVADGEVATEGAETAVDGLEAAGGAVSATGIGVIVGAVLFALATAIQEGITIIGGSMVPGELARTIATPPAIDLPAIAADPTQLSAAYSFFLEATAPAPSYSACLNTTETEAANGAAFTVPGVGDSPSDGLSDGDYLSASGSLKAGETYAPCGNQTPIPAPSSSDSEWLVTPAGSTTATPTANLSYDYDTPATGTSPGATTTVSAYLSGNWVVATAAPDGTTSATVQSARFSYTDWSGNAHVAEIYDDSSNPYFIDITSTADSPALDLSTCVADGTCSVTSTIQAVDGNGKDITVGITPSTRDTSIALSPVCYLGGCYSPPAPLPPSTSPVTFADPGSVSSSLTLTASPAVPLADQPVTLSATLPETAASGTITFYAGSTELCDAVPVTEDNVVTPAPVPVSTGGNVTVYYEGSTTFQSGASCLTQLPAGTVDITADYSGGTTLSLVTAPTIDPTSTTVPITLVYSTRTVVDSVTAQPAGEDFPVSATVIDADGPAPTGTITISNGANPLCTVAATPDSGDPGTSTGTCEIESPTATTLAIRASYGGDASTSASYALATDVAVPQAPTSLTLSPATTDPIVGQPLTYTATLSVAVDASPPVGTVYFSSDQGAFDCGQAPLTSAGDVDGAATYTATCTGAFTEAGSVEVDAEYTGDSNTASSPMVQDDSVTVGQASTAVDVVLTTIGTSPADGGDPAAGEPVVYAATVRALSPSTEGPPIGGTVTFANGGSTVCRSELDADGTATCSTTAGAPGSPPVTATFLGDDQYLGSTATINPTVTNPGSVTILNTSDPDPVVGEPVTYTANVTSTPSDAEPPTGPVYFYAADGFHCASDVTGDGPTRTASCTITFDAPTSDDQVLANYQGSPDGTVLSSSDELDVDVAQVPTTTSVMPSTPSPVVGQPVTYTATVSPSAADTAGPALGGTVTFSTATGVVCAAQPLTGGTVTCTTSFSSPGEPMVTADYSGDPDTVGSNGQATVSVGAATSRTAVSSSVPSPAPGQPTTFTATVVDLAPDTLGPTPTGVVTFTQGKTTLCADVPLGPAGTATCSKAFKTAGPKSATAAYQGDAGSLASSGSVTVRVEAAWSGPASAGLPAVQPHDAAGFYFGLEPGTANLWKLIVTQPTARPVGHYSGTVTVDRGTFGRVAGLNLEPDDSITYTPGSSTISFSFDNESELDGLTFTTPSAASSLTLALDINGVAAKPSAVHLGPSLQSPAANPVVISR